MTRTLPGGPAWRPRPSSALGARLLRRFPRLPSWLILVMLLGALVCGVLLTRYPGLQYDESLFINAATTGGPGSDSTHFVAKRYAGVPVLLMTYIGALKSWLMAPVFAVFGVSVESVRVPMVIVLVLTLIVVVAIVWRYAGPWLAVVAGLVAATDPVYAMMSRSDWGPVALAGLFRVVALLAALRLLSTRRALWLWVLALSLCLGAFNKLDFTLFAISMLAASVTVFGRRWLGVLSILKWKVVPPAVLLALVYSWVYLHMYLPSTQQAPPGQGIRSTLIARTNLVSVTFDGRFLAEYMGGVRPDVGSLLLPASLIALAVALLFLAIASRSTPGESAPDVQMPDQPLTSGRNLVFVTVAGILLFVAMCLTPQVTGPHHAEMLWPYPVLAVVFAVRCIVERRFASRALRAPRVVALCVVSTLIVAAVVSQLGLGIQMWQVLADPTHRQSIWSDDPERVAARLSRLDSATTPDRVLVSDWGIANQVAALASPAAHLQISDPWVDFVANASAPDIAAALGIEPGARFYLLEHTARGQVMAGSTRAGAELLAECQARGGSLRQVYAGSAVVGYDVTC